MPGVEPTPTDVQAELAAARAIASGVPEREMVVMCATALATAVEEELAAVRAELVALRMTLQART